MTENKTGATNQPIRAKSICQQALKVLLADSDSSANAIGFLLLCMSLSLRKSVFLEIFTGAPNGKF